MKQDNTKIKQNFVKYYLLLWFLHLLHILEELIGNAWFIQSIYKTTEKFLIINLILWLIPVALLYFRNTKNKKIYKLFFVYPLIMVLDGIDHIITLIVTGNYLEGSAGVITGIALILISVLTIQSFRKVRPF